MEKASEKITDIVHGVLKSQISAYADGDSRRASIDMLHLVKHFIAFKLEQLGGCSGEAEEGRAKAIIDELSNLRHAAATLASELGWPHWNRGYQAAHFESQFRNAQLQSAKS